MPANNGTTLSNISLAANEAVRRNNADNGFEAYGIGRVLGYAQNSADQGSITTDTNLTNCSTTVTVPSSAGYVRIDAQITLSSTVANDRALLNIKDNTTVIKRATLVLNTTGVNTIYCSWIGQPSAGSKTYQLSVSRASGSGTITVLGTSEYNAHILVTFIPSA